MLHTHTVGEVDSFKCDTFLCVLASRFLQTKHALRYTYIAHVNYVEMYCLASSPYYVLGLSRSPVLPGPDHGRLTPNMYAKQ